VFTSVHQWFTSDHHQCSTVTASVPPVTTSDHQFSPVTTSVYYQAGQALDEALDGNKEIYEFLVQSGTRTFVKKIKQSGTASANFQS